jgi:hypothetical protein
MSGNCYQTLIVQRTVSTTEKRARRAGAAKAAKGKASPIHVPLSESVAVTLQRVSEATLLPQEIVAAEAIRRGIRALTTFSTNH